VGEVVLTKNQMGDLIVSNAGVVTEFIKGEEFVVEFAQLFFDFLHQPCALPVALTGNELDVFGVDADSGGSGSHFFDSVVGFCCLSR